MAKGAAMTFFFFFHVAKNKHGVVASEGPLCASVCRVLLHTFVWEVAD